MPDERAAECRRKAQECRDEAARAFNDADRQTWLRMADEWLALARSAEETAALNQRTLAQDNQNSN
jgi:hypothetical protein